MTYNEALDYISSVAWQGSRPGLTRIAALMGGLGNVQNDLKYIHIAGTNGKGSVSALLSGVLTAVYLAVYYPVQRADAGQRRAHRR